MWFGKEEKQIRNLTMRTTVNEVIGALAMDSCEYNASGATLDNRNYVIVESWRGIERPLPPRTKLLKGSFENAFHEKFTVLDSCCAALKPINPKCTAAYFYSRKKKEK